MKRLWHVSFRFGSPDADGYGDGVVALEAPAGTVAAAVAWRDEVKRLLLDASWADGRTLAQSDLIILSLTDLGRTE